MHLTVPHFTLRLAGSGSPGIQNTAAPPPPLPSSPTDTSPPLTQLPLPVFNEFLSSSEGQSRWSVPPKPPSPPSPSPHRALRVKRDKANLPVPTQFHLGRHRNDVDRGLLARICFVWNLQFHPCLAPGLVPSPRPAPAAPQVHPAAVRRPADCREGAAVCTSPALLASGSPRS